nr:site-specific integrase [Streptomyces sp. SID7804]
MVPEMDWVVDVLGEWVHEVRPQLAPGRHPALWVTERAGRMSPRSIDEAFTVARDAAGLDGALDLHCLRHSYITHLTEFGYPARFVQEQVGHSHDRGRRGGTASADGAPDHDPAPGALVACRWRRLSCTRSQSAADHGRAGDVPHLGPGAAARRAGAATRSPSS